jgi:antitoxin MazE
MRKRLTKTGNSLALVLDRPVLEATGIGASSTVEVSTNGDVIVVTPVRPKKRTAKLGSALEAINARYAGVFKRLAE